MDEAKRGRLQFSVRTLLLVTTAVALLLVPVAWVARERQQMLRELNRAKPRGDRARKEVT